MNIVIPDHEVENYLHSIVIAKGDLRPSTSMQHYRRLKHIEEQLSEAFLKKLRGNKSAGD